VPVLLKNLLIFLSQLIIPEVGCNIFTVSSYYIKRFSLRAKKHTLLLLLPFLFNSYLLAQLAVGEWRTHLPYQSANIVMVTEERVFCSSTGGLFYYGRVDNSLETMSKTDGLSDNGVVAMSWSENDQLALLAYGNANLDIIRENRIINIPDIMKKQVPGDKSINDIAFINGKAYLSCGFGIVVLDLGRLEISDTYYIGDNGNSLNINQIASDGTILYAATETGIRKAELANPFLIDFNSWELVTDLSNPNGSFSEAAFFNGRIFVVYDEPSGGNRIYYHDGTWNEISQLAGIECNELRPTGDYTCCLPATRG